AAAASLQASRADVRDRAGIAWNRVYAEPREMEACHASSIREPTTALPGTARRARDDRADARVRAGGPGWRARDPRRSRDREDCAARARPQHGDDVGLPGGIRSRSGIRNPVRVR